MQKAFDFWEKGKMIKASQLFERIGKAEPTKWMPAYYAAYVDLVSSFGIKDETKLKAKLTKAQEFFRCCKSIGNCTKQPKSYYSKCRMEHGHFKIL